ncbi:glycoside hydrolase [Gaetbulibacter sp. 5U11]|nr:glycoside hydrolase [Gaetbulibacter sp. 5U11]
MNKIVLLLILATLISCGSSKSKRVVTTKSESEAISQTTNKPARRGPARKTTTTTSRNTEDNQNIEVIPISSPLIANIINTAKSYEGVRYKYGGTTKKGMDCSGLIFTAFQSEDISLPRSSSAMATHGDWIDVKEVKEGDLLFFATKRNSRTINHVGLVTSSRLGRVEFIHASTSKGVMTSLLSERYWYFAFVQARRIL